MTPEPIVILGAGLSGLSLACALIERSVEAEIVLVDRRSEWTRDHTWCTWATPGLRFLEHASHRWPAWEIRLGTRHARAHSSRHAYVHLRADDLYAAALARIERAPNVSFRLGESDAQIMWTADGRPALVTRSGLISASRLFDARGPGPGGARSPGDLVQTFHGVELELEDDRFDPSAAILMDFTDAGPSGVRFIYLLPFSARHALVEDTFIGRAAARPEMGGDAIAAWLQRAGATGTFRALHEERGELSMAPSAPRDGAGSGVYALGAAGGAIRPSSGYAFSRIQRDCTAIAAAVAEDRPLPARMSARRTEVLDRLFLTALSADATRFPEIFHTLAGAVPGDRFARFMTDTSSAVDDAAIVSALPPVPFLRAAGVIVGRRLPRPMWRV